MITGFLIGLWGFVWVRLLCTPGEVCDFVPRWAMPLADGSDLGEKAYKAICGCAKCHAGQVAFWSAFLCDRDIFEAFTVFVTAVASAFFLERLEAKLER